MAEKNQIDVLLNFEAETDDLKKAQDEVGKVTKKTKELPGAVDKATKQTNKLAGAFKSIGGVLGAIGIGAFLFDAVKRAGQASDAMNELNTAWSETIGLISNELDPAIRFVGQGLAGLMSILVGLTRFIRENLIGAWGALAKAMSGDFAGAWEEAKKQSALGTEKLLDQLVIAGERAAGLSSAQEAIQSKIILESTKARLKNERLTGAEKIKIIDAAEKESFRVLRASGEFIQASKRQQAIRELEILKEFAAERLTARAQEFTEQQNALNAEVGLLKAQAGRVGVSWQERLVITKKAFEKQLELINVQADATMEAEANTQQRRETALIQFHGEINTIEREERTMRLTAEQEETRDHYAIMQENLTLSREERLAIIDEFENAELDLINEMNEAEGLSEFEANQRQIALARNFAAQRRALMNQELQERTAFFNQMISSAANAAAQELASSRNAGRAARAALADGLDSLTKAATRSIAISGAAATADSFKNGGGWPGGVIPAALTAAFYVSLAAVVGAGGGAIANALRPPAQAPTTIIPAVSSEGFLTTTPITAAALDETGTAIRDSRSKAAAARAGARGVAGAGQRVGEAPGQGVGGEMIVFNFQSLDGRMSPEALDLILKTVNRAKRGEGK